MGSGLVGALQLLDLAAIQLALALVLGGATSLRWLRTADSAWADRCGAVSRLATKAGGLLGVVTLAAAVWLQAATMAEVPLSQAGDTVVTLLLHTHYGHVALIGGAAWLVVAAVAWRRAGSSAVWLALLVVAWSRSAVSHAANSGDASLDIAVDVVHLMATSLWVGLVILAAATARPGSVAVERVDARRWVASLSACATVTLALVVATGVYKVWRAVPAWASLPGSDYGWALFVKLGLVAAAVLLGGYNRMRVLPQLDDRDPTQHDPVASARWHARLLAVLRVETVVLVLVVGCAALLASTEPPG